MGAAAILLAVVGTLIAGPAPAQAVPDPDAPATVTVVPGRRMLVATWTSPAAPAGLDHYTATTSPAGGTCTVSALTCTFSNLAATTSYTVSVEACYDPGVFMCSTPTVSSSVMTGQPGTPAAPTVAYNGDPNTVLVSWVAPPVGAGIASYVITATPSTGLTGSCKTLIAYPATSCGFGGLVSGTSYTFKVAASGVTNDTGFTGSSAASLASTAKIAGPPGAPLNVAAVRIDDNGLTLNWSPPTTGAPVGGYTVTSADTGIGGFDVNPGQVSGCTTSGCAFTGLSPTRAYTFQVTANGVGADSGSSSTMSAAVFPGAPGAPAAPYVELGTAGTVTVTWSASVAGGTPTSYVVTPHFVAPAAAPTPSTCTFPATSCDFSGLTANQPYTFTVTATNASGSATSEPSDPVVSSPPAQPGQLAVTLGATAGSATVNWVQPANGGVVNYFTVIPTPFGGPAGTACVAGPAAQACSFTGLSTTLSYTFVVTAVGDLGSVASDPTDPVLLAVPGAPGTPQVVLTSTTAATVTWTAPTGGGSVASYTVVPIGAGAGSANVPGSCLLPGATSCAITGLTAATSYTFAVTAVNGAGPSTTATSGAVVTSAPNPPGTPAVVLNSASTATLTWAAPSGGGPVASYTVVSIGAGSPVVSACAGITALTCSVSGLAAATAYQFKVTAINGAGGPTDSPPSAVVYAQAPGVPGTPTVLVTSSTTATVTWTAPADGGPVVSYTLVSNGTDSATIPGLCVTTSALTCALTGLTPSASYRFKVTATNAVGSTDSANSAATVTAVPGAPGTPTVVVNSTTAATVSWTAPTTGAPPTSYSVTPNGPGSPTVPGSCLVAGAVTCAVTGLTAGATYTFTVTASNGVGAGTPAISAAVVLAAPNAPGTPTVVVDSATSATVSWTAPSAGGGPVVGYQLLSIGAGDIATIPGSCNPTTALSCVLTGLTTGGLYQFRVVAQNAISTTTSPNGSSVYIGAPGAPTSLQVVVNSATAATVSWTAPGGGPVAGYTVVPSGGGTPTVPSGCLLPAAVSCAVTGLASGGSYTFTVTAINGAGAGTPAISSSVTLAAPTAPGTPTVVVTSTTAATVSWTAPTGGGPVVSYVLVPTGPGSPMVTCTTPTDVSCVVSALTPGASYTFVVTATNAVGSTPSVASAAVVTSAPGAPGTPTVLLTSATAATVSWTAPTTGGPVVSYALVPIGPGSPVATCTTPTALSCAVTGLVPSGSYTFLVFATNAVGTTSPVASYAVTVAAPNAPGTPTVVLTSATAATVSWTAPTGGPVVSYALVATGPGTPVVTCSTPTSLSCPVTALTSGGSYTFVVTATNAVGSVPSAASGAVLVAPPGAPTALQVVVNSATAATLSWTAPTGGGPVTGYTVVASGGSATVPGGCLLAGAVSCTVTGLTPGGSYTFTVTATNAAGAGTPAASAAVVTAVPGTPGKPTAVLNTSTTATLSWTAPTGGGPVVSYTVVSTGTDTLAIPGSCVTTSSLSCALVSLVAGGSYTFKVTATNQVGGADSVDSDVLLVAGPGVPGTPTAEVISTSTVRVTWTAPTSGSPVTSYTVMASTVAAPGAEFGAPGCINVVGLTCDFGGLGQTEPYQFVVIAVGLAGNTRSAAKSTAISLADPNAGVAPTVILAGPNAVKVTWTAPTGGAVTGYTVTSVPALTAPAGCTNVLALTCVFDHLASGTSYTFTVAAMGVSGTTVASAASVAIIPGPPDAPAKPTVALTGVATQVMVSWVAPGAGAGIASYTVESSQGNLGCSSTPGPSATSCLVTGLATATAYTFRVQAVGVTGSGNSAFSPMSDAISLGGTGAPTTPTKPTVALTGVGQVSVVWTMPGGSGPVTGYSVAASPEIPAAATGCAPSAVIAPCVFNGLLPSVTYTFTVTAHGPMGDLTSTPSDSVRPARPGTPGTPTVQAGASGTVTVSWAASPLRGPLTSYSVSSDPEVSPSGDCAGTTLLTCLFTGLSPTTSYTFLVTATGPAGDTPSVARSAAIMPSAPGVPGTPTVQVTGPNTVQVSWAPSSGGGLLTNYSVTSDPAVTPPAGCTGTTALSCNFVGLDATTSYTFLVTASGPGGTTASAARSVAVIAAAPGAPGTPTVSVTAPHTVRVTWTPSTGGVLTGYTVSSTPAVTAPAVCVGISTLTCDFTGLTSTTAYTFVVTANGPGGNTASGTSASISPALPAAPGTPKVQVANGGAVTVTWTAPIGGATVTSYTVTSDPVVTPSGDCLSTTNLTCTFTGLDTATSYTFLVTANGVAGSTPSVARSAAIITAAAGLPGKPTVSTTVAGTVHVTWTAPAPGGGPISGYTVDSNPSLTSPCVAVSVLSCDFTGLGSTSHTFVVTALGVAGNTSSASSEAITAAAPGAAAAPTVALAGPNAVRVSWLAPSGGPITSYAVTSNPVVTPPAGCTDIAALTCVFDRLDSGTSYTFQVVATGPVGTPTTGTASVAIMAGPPDAPAKPTVAALSSTGVTVSWVPPTTGGAYTGYTVQSSPSGIGCATAAGSSATGCDVTGLVAGTSYTFRVRATGATGGGNSAFSPASDSIKVGALSAPTDINVAAANHQIAVSWTASANFGGQLASYKATASPGGLNCVTTGNTATECIITGLTNGTTYTVTVVAVGLTTAGDSVASVPSARVRPTAGAPGTPTGVVALAANQSAIVTWVAPAGVGDGIARYTATASGTPDGQFCTTPNGTTLTCSITGLTNGSTYQITVVAVGANASGNSSSSAPVGVTVRNTPSAPTNVIATLSGTSISVAFTPSSSGGAVTNYTATASGGATSPTCTASPCVISSLPGGSYTVTVVANGSGSNGPSPASAPSNAVVVASSPAPTLPASAPTGSLVSGVLTSSAGTTMTGSGSTTIAGTGYAPYAGITLGIYGGPALLGSNIVADSAGSFSVQVTLPAVAAGSHAIIAAGRTASAVRYSGITVTIS